MDNFGDLWCPSLGHLRGNRIWSFQGVPILGLGLKPGLSCVVNFEYVRNAIVAYANDHKGKLPKAETWQDDIKSYYTKETLKEKNDNPFDSLNPEGNWECKSSGNKVTGFAFNSDLSGKNLSDIKDPEGTIVVFEVPESGRNLHQSYTPRSKYDSPKIFGSERGWIAMPLTGSAHGLPKNINVNVNGKDYSPSDSSNSGDTGSSSDSNSGKSGKSSAGDDSTN